MCSRAFKKQSASVEVRVHFHCDEKRGLQLHLTPIRRNKLTNSYHGASCHLRKRQQEKVPVQDRKR